MDAGRVCADFTLADFKYSHERWARGECPCCGSVLCEWEWDGELFEPRPIGEGVTICGRCVGNDHDEPPEFARLMLEAIALGARRKRAEPKG